MSVLNVLHVASFSGNIGDNANHSGFRAHLAKELGVELNFTDFEIREVYWKAKAFDHEFVDLANKHDLLVVGGGNYFELWVDRSQTGCSIDISLDLLKAIKTPIVFNALGVDPAQGASPQALQRFRSFLDVVITSPTMMLSCRNDGSRKALQEIVGEQYEKEFYHVPDAGFFTSVLDSYHPELEQDKKNVVIQLAGDMLETRFPAALPDEISYDQFLEGVARTIAELCANNSNVILVPHIFRDLTVIDQLLNLLPDDVRRRNVKIAGYLTGEAGQSYIFDLYKKADLVLAMRFHANVCSLGLGTPCIGLVNYRQIEELYEELNLQEYAVEVNKKGFDELLLEQANRILWGDGQTHQLDLLPWENKLKAFHADIREWLKRLGTLS